MESWKRYDEAWLSDKEDFNSYLNMKEVGDADYKHEKKEYKPLK